jgi:catechol 2,3-dioxygenase-like lactoylglutathione lyase family enzyme
VKLSQVRLLVDDVPAAFRFYRDVLRLEPAFGGEDRVVYIRDPAGNPIELHEELRSEES